MPDFYFIAPTITTNNPAGASGGGKYMIRSLDGRALFVNVGLSMIDAHDICDELNAAREYQPKEK